MSDSMKYCTGCKQYKLRTEFSMNRSSKDGLQNYCILCKRKIGIEYIRKNKDKLKEYSIRNRDKLLAKKRQYSREHKEEIIKKAVEYKRNRRKVDVGFRIRDNLSRRISYAIHGKDKSLCTKNLIGCSIEELKDYLENKFDESMTWENYGKYWHVDHIIPCASFNLNDIEEQKKCFHYTNLQPLEAHANLRKGKHLLLSIE